MSDEIAWFQQLFQGTLSTEFGLAFKKLSKKDSTTKLKGLAELATMFKTMQTEEIKVVLHSWVTSFLRLSLINNLRVRVALHKAFAELLAVAKKELAPFLKSLIVCALHLMLKSYPLMIPQGPWLCHMFDPCKEVSVAAQQSFKVLRTNYFYYYLANCSWNPDCHTRKEAQCGIHLLQKRNISPHRRKPRPNNSDLKYLSFPSSLFVCCNLLIDIITGGGKAANEKTEERYSRVISSSILALGHFISLVKQPLLIPPPQGNNITDPFLCLPFFVATLPDNVNEELVERYNALLDQKFWKFLSIKKFAVIRKATYQLIPVICTKLKPLFEKNLPTISSTVLGILADTESDAQKQLWEALLTFLQSESHISSPPSNQVVHMYSLHPK